MSGLYSPWGSSGSGVALAGGKESTAVQSCQAGAESELEGETIKGKEIFVVMSFFVKRGFTLTVLPWIQC